VNEEEEIVLKLSLGELRRVAALIEGGIYRDVQLLLASIYRQVNSQITAANERAIAAEIQASIAAGDLTPSDGLTDDQADPKVISQPPALH
jgi:hypothetical protein